MASIDQVLAEAPARLAAVTSTDQLNELEAELIGRRSLLADTRRRLSELDPAERPRVGARLNQASEQLRVQIDQRRRELELAAESALLAEDRVDVTLPAVEIRQGRQHLLTSIMDEVCDIFASLGYRVATGPEVELAWYNFDALNTPPTHPSRHQQDTLYVDFGDPADEVLLRTQTSPMQARYMETHQPPVYVVVPGRTYRADTLDATHSPVFHQIEGLAVEQGITFGDLKGTLAHFAHEFFGPEQRIRLLPHFFPFTEPSAEMLVSCFACQGGPCRVCGGSGWIELMGCGMVDPAVFEAVGYDPERYTGFAFGMGVERLAMVRHGIGHIRHFFENDLRVLGQFR